MIGRSGYYIVSVWNPLHSSLINEATGRAGVAAEVAEQANNKLYKTSVYNCGGMFFPLIVECVGCWSPKSLEHLENIPYLRAFKGMPVNCRV